MFSKVSRKTLLLVWGTVSGVCLIIGGLLAAFLFETLVNAIIVSKVPLLPGTDISQAWMSPPVKPLLKIYYFNVTNPEVKPNVLHKQMFIAFHRSTCPVKSFGSKKSVLMFMKKSGNARMLFGQMRTWKSVFK